MECHGRFFQRFVHCRSSHGCILLTHGAHVLLVGTRLPPRPTSLAVMSPLVGGGHEHGKTGFVAPDRPLGKWRGPRPCLTEAHVASVPRTGTGAPTPSSLQASPGAWVARTAQGMLRSCALRWTAVLTQRCRCPCAAQRVILVRVHTLPRVQRLRLVCADHGVRPRR